MSTRQKPLQIDISSGVSSVTIRQAELAHKVSAKRPERRMTLVGRPITDRRLDDTLPAAERLPVVG
jgi:hypothetical protein